jgi:hypothetical protein
MTSTHMRISGIAPTALVVVVVFCVYGCHSIDQAPFSEFSVAVLNTQAGTESNSGLAYDMAKLDFVNRFIANPNAQLSSLQLLPDRTGMHLDYVTFSDENHNNRPLFIKIGQSRNVLLAVDSGFCTYASLLLSLAGNNSLTDNDLSVLSKNINAISTSAWNLAGEKSPDGSGQLIGMIFKDAANAFIKHRIKENLKKAINGNQPMVESYAMLGKENITILRNAISEAYTGQFNELDKKWTKVKSVEEKTALVSQVLALDVKYGAAIELLAKLEEAYAILPLAHKELALSLDNDSNDIGFGDIKKLKYISQSLKILSDNLASEISKK